MKAIEMKDEQMRDVNRMITLHQEDEDQANIVRD